MLSYTKKQIFTIWITIRRHISPRNTVSGNGVNIQRCCIHEENLIGFS